jgi:hypothetical protein
VVGLALISSRDGGPRGWRIGCSPRPPKVELTGVEGTAFENFGKEVFGPVSVKALLAAMALEEKELHFLCPRLKLADGAGGGLEDFFVTNSGLAVSFGGEGERLAGGV